MRASNTRLTAPYSAFLAKISTYRWIVKCFGVIWRPKREKCMSNANGTYPPFQEFIILSDEFIGLFDRSTRFGTIVLD